MPDTLTYIRLTKVRELSVPIAQPMDGSAGHIGVGYFVEGWFLEEPCLGRSMLMLRFRRNETYRLGLFTSSPITFFAENEIRTVNSVYRLEQFSFERSEP